MVEVTPWNGRKLAIRAAIAGAIGAIVLAIGIVLDPERALLAYLFAFGFVFTIAVGALIFLQIGYTANARWMAVVRRASEIVTLPLPALALLFVPIALGLAWLYPWHTTPAELGHHERAILEHRSPFLNTPAFLVRAVIYFAVLIAAAGLLRRWSVRRDALDTAPIDPERALGRERRFSAALLPPVGLAFTFATIDWFMSLEPVWYSTMFPINLFAGGFLGAICVITIVTAATRASVTAITLNHFYALGRMMFAFNVFWAYTAFFQLLLIRIANKPEEITFFVARYTGGWEVVMWILVLGHFAIPFLLLLPKALKFRPRALSVIAAWLLVMHAVDIYWNVMPSRAYGPHWVDLAALLALVGSAVAFVAWRQHRVALVAARDPFFADGAAYRSPL